jgi:hypothetical protein
LIGLKSGGRCDWVDVCTPEFVSIALLVTLGERELHFDSGNVRNTMIRRFVFRETDFQCRRWEPSLAARETYKIIIVQLANSAFAILVHGEGLSSETVLPNASSPGGFDISALYHGIYVDRYPDKTS